MKEIDLQTSWDDSGYDCDHCGGRILERTDKETGQPAKICFQCEVCGCQWAPSGAVLRVGHMRQCPQAQRDREAATQDDNLTPTLTIVIVVGVILLVLMLILVGGLVAIRFLIPIAIFAFIAVAAFRYGRERMWW